ncbi:MAG TPA: hypothetical protein VH374_10875 [Polyangia bacterium]|nr:hypothetical protein [Polyangia bacterium]
MTASSPGRTDGDPGDRHNPDGGGRFAWLWAVWMGGILSGFSWQFVGAAVRHFRR